MNENDGFTITELVVAMLIGSLIIGFCFTAFGFSQRFYLLWNNKNEAGQAAIHAYHTISYDIERAKKVELSSDSLTVTKVGNKVVVYRFRDGNLWRNDVLVNRRGDMIAIDLKRAKQEYEISVSIMSGRSILIAKGTATIMQSSKEQYESR